VHTDWLAIHNAVLYNHFRNGQGDAGKNADPTPVAMVDLGASELNVLVSSPRSLWFRSIGLGTDRINKTLARRFQITFAEAEKWKRDPAGATAVGSVLDAFQTVYDEYLQEIRRSLGKFREAFPGAQPTRLLAMSGVLHAPGLMRHLRLGR
jgi:Tfp pilus assembly PilM family ATPase